MTSLRVAIRLSKPSSECEKKEQTTQKKTGRKRKVKSLESFVVPTRRKVQQKDNEVWQLPLEVSSKVVEWLEAVSVGRWALVSKKWRNVSLKHWQSVHVSLNQGIPQVKCRTLDFLKEEEDQPWIHDHNYRCEHCGLGGEILMCDFCNCVYHLNCVDPPLSEAPQGLWRCPACVRDKKAPIIGSTTSVFVPTLGLVSIGGYELSSFTANRGVFLLSKSHGETLPMWKRLPIQGVPGADFCSHSTFFISQLRTFVVFVRRRQNEQQTPEIDLAIPPQLPSRRRRQQNTSLRTWRRNAHLAGATTYDTVYLLRLTLDKTKSKENKAMCGSWISYSLTGDIPLPRLDAVLCDDGQNRLLLSGGFSPDSNTYFQGLYLLDLQQHSWRCLYPDREIALTQVAPIQYSDDESEKQNTFLVQNNIEFTLPERGPVSVALNLRPKVNTAERFDEINFCGGAANKKKKTKVRTPRNSLKKCPGPRAGHAAARTSTRLWYFGGMGRRTDGSMGYDDQVWTLDVDSWQWSRQPCRGASPRARAGHSMISIGSHLVVFGGLNSKTFLADLAILHMPTLTWSRPNFNLVPSTRMRPAILPLASTSHSLFSDQSSSETDSSDTVSSRILLFGGTRAWGLSAFAPTATEYHDGDLYELALLPPSSPAQ